MACHRIETPEGTIIACTRGERRRRCHRCRAWATVLCDFPLRGGRTCDRPCCPAHARPVGPDRDYRQEHP